MSKPIDIFYLCDGDACKEYDICSIYCEHTADIVHACHEGDLDGRLFKYVDRGDRIGFFEVVKQ